QKVRETLDKLHKAAGDRTENLMSTILAAVKAYATIGEISDTLTEIYGEYQPLTIF
ncbi:methylmalonyl-CoA mutase, partial [Candidatus Bathyarchaeota archaeon]|nr:methylmalonyl-CoA mutase [Candidatus Bathyarchaeota archaeon]